MPRSDAAVPTLCTKASICAAGLRPDLVGHLVIGGELVGVLHLVGPEAAGLALR